MSQFDTKLKPIPLKKNYSFVLQITEVEEMTGSFKAHNKYDKNTCVAVG